MRSSDDILKTELNEWPEKWEDLLNLIGPQANDDNFWEAFVNTHLATVVFSDKSQYKDIFETFWKEHRSTLLDSPNGLINATEYGYDVYVKNSLKNLSEEERLKFINHHLSTGDTALHKAVKNKDLLMVELLIENGAYINAIGFFNQTPLHCAVSCNETDIVNYLLKAGASQEIKDNASRHPIHIAAESGSEEVVNLLLKHDPELIHSVSKEGRTPFFIALMNGRVNVMNVLIAHGDDPNQKQAYTGFSGLHQASMANNPKMVKFFIANNANLEELDRKKMTALQLAANQGHLALEAASVLIDAKANVNAQSRDTLPPLYLLAAKTDETNPHPKSIEFAKLLIKHGANIDPERYGETIFDKLGSGGQKKYEKQYR